MTSGVRFSAALAATIPDARTSFFGGEGGWAAQACIYDAPRGWGEEAWELAYPNLIAWPISGIVTGHLGGRQGRRGGGSGTFSLQPGHAPGRYLASGPVRFGHLIISDDLLARVAEGCASSFGSDQLRPDIVLASDRCLVDLLNAYAGRSRQTHAPPSRVEMEGRALIIVDHLLRRHHGGSPHPKEANVLRSDWRVSRTIAQLEAGWMQDVGLDALAAEVGLTVRHYSALFAAATGLPPHRWVLRRRIERACELLADPRMSITGIAFSLGFSSSQHFATTFRKHMGTSPSRFRRERAC